MTERQEAQGTTAAFTVVIPVYNRPDYVRSSLAVFLTPEAAGLDVIVVDDGSTDDTPATVEALAAQSQGARIRLLHQANAGPGAARNRGVQAADTDWVAFLDSDDLWLPWTIATLRGVLAGPEAAKAGILFLATQDFRDPAELERLSAGPVEIRRHATMLDFRLEDKLPMVASCNLMMRRDIFLSLNGFTTEVRHSEDTDLLYRANLAGEAWAIAAPPLVGYRTGNADSLSYTNFDHIRNRTLYLINRNRAGLYPGPKDKVAKALARSVAYMVRMLFRVGCPRPAYVVYRQGMGIFAASRSWDLLFKLPLTPALHYLRPRNYPFRWRTAEQERARQAARRR